MSQTWKVLAVLLEHCSSEESGLDTKDEFGNTPFMVACCYGHNDIVQILLDNLDGIELKARGYNGWTVLKIAFMWACYYGHKDVVQLLLEHSDPVDLNPGEMIMK